MEQVCMVDKIKITKLTPKLERKKTSSKAGDNNNSDQKFRKIISKRRKSFAGGLLLLVAVTNYILSSADIISPKDINLFLVILSLGYYYIIVTFGMRCPKCKTRLVRNSYFCSGCNLVLIDIKQVRLNTTLKPKVLINNFLITSILTGICITPFFFSKTFELKLSIDMLFYILILHTLLFIFMTFIQKSTANGIIKRFNKQESQLSD
jgi:hypothetical protein